MNLQGQVRTGVWWAWGFPEFCEALFLEIFSWVCPIFGHFYDKKDAPGTHGLHEKEADWYHNFQICALPQAKPANWTRFFIP
jgi:hypothetical protein